MKNEKHKSILVLGSTGMLGSMVYEYLSACQNFSVFGTYNNDKMLSCFSHNIPELYLNALDPSDNIFDELLDSHSFDYVINCIGVINKYSNSGRYVDTVNAININSIFPYRLNQLFSVRSPKTKIIQIATDCVYDGKQGSYLESDSHTPGDIYGKTKSLGEVESPSFLNIRCSIIGPEVFRKVSLFEWFLGHEDKNIVNGYGHHVWNGVTTLQFAKLCREVIETDSFAKLRGINHVIHYTPNVEVTKYELLTLIANNLDKDVIIKEVLDHGRPINRTLSSNYQLFKSEPMGLAISELVHYIRSESKIFSI